MRHHDEELSDAYWRRRAYVLTGVLLTVGLLAWACSGGDDRKERLRNAGAVSTPSASATSAAAVAPSALPTVTVTAIARVTVTPAVPKKPGDACDPGNVVINLAGVKPVYAPGEQPVFQVTVVNTGSPACTFDVGPAGIELKITSGSDRIWSSADCATAASSIQLLQRGIPYVGTIGWDLRRSAPKCAGTRAPVRKGTYVAQIKAGDIKVRRQVFHLG